MFNNQLKFNPLNAELNPICLLLALLGAHHILHVSRIGVKAVMPAYSISNKTLISTYSFFNKFYSKGIKSCEVLIYIGHAC
jgi:hypothetical protein